MDVSVRKLKVTWMDNYDTTPMSILMIGAYTDEDIVKFLGLNLQDVEWYEIEDLDDPKNTKGDINNENKETKEP